MYGTTSSMIHLYPVLAASHRKCTSQPFAPGKGCGHGVVGAVPPRVLHQGQRDSRKHGRLGVRARHSLVLEDALLPVGEGGAFATLVL